MSPPVQSTTNPADVTPGAARTLALAAVILIAAWIIYAPVVRGDWLWDDKAELSQNPEVSGPGGLAKIWLEPSHNDYFPLKSTVQWIAWRIFGDSPPGYHVLNILLHALSGLLVWRLFARLGIRLAWLGGLLFVVHPLAVESVAWIAELKNTLALPPLLLAFCAYLDFDATGRRSRLVSAVLWFLASLLCKTSGVMLPFVLLLYHGWKSGRITRGNILATLPLFLTSLVLGLVTIHFQHTRAILTTEIPIGGPLERLAVAGLAAGFYAWKFAVPLQLVPVYPQWQITAGDVSNYLPWLGAIALFIAAWRARATWGRHVLFGVGAYVALVLPVLGFVAMSYMKYSWVADHFVYLPMLGLIGLVTGALGSLGASSAARQQRVALVGAAVCAALLVVSRRHAAVFRDSEALWNHTLRHNPTEWTAHNNLGSYLQTVGRPLEALPHFHTAIAGDPHYAAPHSNLGVALTALGRHPEALEEFRTALRLDPSDVAARTNLANNLAQQGRVDEAIEEYRAALRTQPGLIEARTNLANALYLKGRVDEALAELGRVMALRPDQAEAYDNAGKMHMRVGRTPEAIRYYELAVKLAPRNASFRNDLGYALALAGRTKEAATQLEEAVRLDPNHLDARVNLGGVRYQAGDLPGATEQFEAALRIDPSSAEARQNLAVIRKK